MFFSASEKLEILNTMNFTGTPEQRSALAIRIIF